MVQLGNEVTDQMPQKAKPGIPAPKSGQYKSTGSKTEVTAGTGRSASPGPRSFAPYTF
ncbi:hypothetical protein OG756_20785 [Streptomyces sp. NBC_01310]|uniref:hypothetical protein n=1 Tax=Streptomyces sp. NBC_01310 TaxID=2903820 RepID=UPI0035B581EF|nr:hypothetical protein OG756_20785 [Streptomyces sp. NBC_01310]